jgi:hypothetical protein
MSAVRTRYNRAPRENSNGGVQWIVDDRRYYDAAIVQLLPTILSHVSCNKIETMRPDLNILMRQRRTNVFSAIRADESAAPEFGGA